MRARRNRLNSVDCLDMIADVLRGRIGSQSKQQRYGDERANESMHVLRADDSTTRVLILIQWHLISDSFSIDGY